MAVPGRLATVAVFLHEACWMAGAGTEMNALSTRCPGSE